MDAGALAAVSLNAGTMAAIGVIVGLVALAPLVFSLYTSKELHRQEERAHQHELPPG
jgi:uncharacterized membrane protein YebE (DUF533 family)